jgi:DNA-binding GntR family transcriptional regulator
MVQRSPVTLKDVAKRAGVSAATASHALSGNIRVSDVARARVRDAARELDYSLLPRSRKLQAVRTEKAMRVRGSGAQTVYESLRRSILELEVTPGSPLDEAALSERFGMSRTPIREAMVRLAAEGLIQTLPNRNTIVAPIDVMGLPVYFEALSLTHRVTTRLAAVNRKPEHLERIRELAEAFAHAVQLEDALEMLATNREFHVAIAEAGGNPYFTSMFSRLLDEGRRILLLYYSSFENKLPQKYVVEHDLIVKAIAASDPELADKLAADHASQIKRQVQDYLDRAGKL